MAVSEHASSQTSPASLPPNVVTLPQTAQLEALYTIIRNKDTGRWRYFISYIDVSTISPSSPKQSKLLLAKRTKGSDSKAGSADEETAQAKLFYSKLPEDIANRYVLLLDPMLATGGSAIKAVEVLKEAGVLEERIMFLNLIASPEGIRAFCGKYPALRMITGWIDKGLNEKAYIIPGLGDFGERRYTI
ncbi:unnamed protein product [Rhizoctonia solani]